MSVMLPINRIEAAVHTPPVAARAASTAAAAASIAAHDTSASNGVAAASITRLAVGLRLGRARNASEHVAEGLVEVGALYVAVVINVEVEHEGLAGWQDGKVARWQGGKVARWQGGGEVVRW